MNKFHLLPDHVVNHIFSYYNPYQNYFTNNILIELKQKNYFKRVVKQLSQMVVYNRSRTRRRFAKYCILRKLTTHEKNN